MTILLSKRRPTPAAYMLLSCAFIASSCCSAEPQLQITVSTMLVGNADWDWTQARTAVVPGERVEFVTTMSRTAKVGSHGYHDVYSSTSRDEGHSWSKPQRIPTLQRAAMADGYEVVAGDLYPGWHAATKTVLITGKTFNFEGGSKENWLREQVAYAVFHPINSKYGPLQTLELPPRDHAGAPIIAPNAGCHQRVDLENGNILLPIRYQKSAEKRIYTTIVARCEFDGTTLTYREHGSELNIGTGRGLYEPSLVEFQGEFLLTLRADDGAYVAKSHDGLHFDTPIPWTFDDETLLGSYNTQQHWATIANRLYLIYTRRGAKNDHIMRHRAPLFIAQVDPATLRVIRATEQIVVPENNATLGNSGVCQISAKESWVTVAEGRVSAGPRQGQNNKILVARITTN